MEATYSASFVFVVNFAYTFLKKEDGPVRIERKTKQGITPFQMLVSYYFIAIAVSFGLLLLPWVHQPGVEVPLIDTLFTAVSAVSVTGLTVFDISQTYSSFGMAVLLVIM